MMRTSYKSIIVQTCLTGFLLLGSGAFAQEVDEPEITEFHTIEVQGVRADEKTPITQKTVNRAEVEETYYSQEMPLLLDTMPNITSSTDGGHNLGYTYFRLRGIDQTRINMTLEGVPLNEPEDQGVYFSNYPDFANSIESMQLQRGVGTSSNGVASYAGSINFETPDGLGDKQTEVQAGYGSFDTYRISVENNTGLLTNNVAFYTRFSTFETTGYKYNSGNLGYSFFLSGGYYGPEAVLKVIAFTGRSFNQMAWYAVSETDIDTDPRINYNMPREDDDFRQSLLILKHIRTLGSDAVVTTTAFYNKLDGEWDLDLEPLGGGDTVNNYQLDSYFYGLLSNYNFTRDTIRLNVGVHAQQYQREHAMSLLPDTAPEYKNTGFKDEASSYLKIGYDYHKFTLFGDTQLRWTRFRYRGDLELNDVEWTFFNPKAGLMFHVREELNLYASAGQAHREPTRTDMFAGEDDPSVYYDIDPESVTDYEVGTNFSATNVKLQANVYYMDFQNEITLLGALGANGLPLMTNVEKSFRSGLELDFQLTLRLNQALQVRLTSNTAYSYNRIIDSGRNFQPLYTPQLIVNQGIWFTNSSAKIRLGFEVKHHTESYIDWENTATTPAFTILNTQLALTLFKEHSLILRVNNLTDTEYFTNGYTIEEESYFYVNPPLNFFITLKMVWG
ncbi:TonB-dependent receptor [candidate division CSSED10-310 bacterium]|uniref:TonB-dependent receptor n=1 Tax=candidate division CSSED10-310 bacterium TaxID=2855610 RepID=A0ABV6Z493_UNCC1